MRADIITERALKNAPRARSDDKELLLLVWESYGLYLSETQRAKLKAAPSMETIVRIRRKLQEQGLYIATDRVRRNRNFKAMEVQQRMPTTKPEKIEPLLGQTRLID